MEARIVSIPLQNCPGDISGTQCVTGPGGPAHARQPGATGDADGDGRQVCGADHLPQRTLPLRKGGGLLPGLRSLFVLVFLTIIFFQQTTA